MRNHSFFFGGGKTAEVNLNLMFFFLVAAAGVIPFETIGLSSLALFFLMPPPFSFLNHDSELHLPKERKKERKKT